MLDNTIQFTKLIVDERIKIPVHFFSSLVVYLKTRKKVSLYLDEGVWAKFKESVFRRQGTLRKLSDEVEKLLRDSLIDESIESIFEKMGIKMKTFVSPKQVKNTRPKLIGPPSEILIREMRGKRLA